MRCVIFLLGLIGGAAVVSRIPALLGIQDANLRIILCGGLGGIWGALWFNGLYLLLMDLLGGCNNQSSSGLTYGRGFSPTNITNANVEAFSALQKQRLGDMAPIINCIDYNKFHLLHPSYKYNIGDTITRGGLDYTVKARHTFLSKASPYDTGRLFYSYTVERDGLTSKMHELESDACSLLYTASRL